MQNGLSWPSYFAVRLIPIFLLYILLFGVKGHLLVLENLNSLQLNHGLMEAAYVNHPTISGIESSDPEQNLSVSMTANIDAAGNLLLGKLLFHDPCTSDDCICCFWVLAIIYILNNLFYLKRFPIKQCLWWLLFNDLFSSFLDTHGSFAYTRCYFVVYWGTMYWRYWIF